MLSGSLSGRGLPTLLADTPAPSRSQAMQGVGGCRAGDSFLPRLAGPGSGQPLQVGLTWPLMPQGACHACTEESEATGSTGCCRRLQPGTGRLGHCDFWASWTQNRTSSCPPLQPPFPRGTTGWLGSRGLRGPQGCGEGGGGLPEDPSRGSGTD